MKISIALCTYNGATFLNKQLESFLQQTRQPDELIVCDDCSGDDTVQILKDFARTTIFPVRIYFNENNLGYIKNFEKAISLCTGDLIFLSDQDDIWHSEKLQIFEREFNRQPEVGLIFSNANLVNQNLESLDVEVWQWLNFPPALQQLFKDGRGLPEILNRNFVPGYAMAFRSKYKNLILPFPTDIPEVIHDYWIAMVIMATAKIALLPQTLVQYRQHGGQQIGAKSSADENVAQQPTVLSVRAEYCETIIKYEALLKRLEQGNDKSERRRQTSIKYLKRQIRHIKTRVSLQNGKLDRMPDFIRELLTFGYHRYSAGFQSIFKDLLLLARNLKSEKKH